MTAPYFADELVTLYLGDCHEVDAWLGADVLVTDPPYGTDAAGYGYGRRNANGRPHDSRTGAQIAGDMTTGSRDAMLEAWGDRPRLLFGSPRLPDPPGAWQHRLVWDKGQLGTNGGPWRYAHESIYVAGDGWRRVSDAASSVLRVVMPNNSPEKRDHPHAKPVPLMEALIEAAPAGVIADPFAGSGATVIAARNLGRRVVAVEISERHCETIARRLSQQAFVLAGL